MKSVSTIGLVGRSFDLLWFDPRRLRRRRSHSPTI